MESGSGGSLTKYRDLISGAVLSGVGIFLLVEASRLPFGTVSAPAAGFFPVCLSVALILSAAAIMIRSLLARPAAPEEAVLFDARSWFVVFTIFAFLLYAFALESIGYVPCTLLLMLLMLRGFGRLAWRRALLIAFITVIPAYGIFVKLGVPLPRGLMPL